MSGVNTQRLQSESMTPPPVKGEAGWGFDLAPTLLRGSPCYLRCRSVPTQSMGTSHSALEVEL